MGEEMVQPLAHIDLRQFAALRQEKVSNQTKNRENDSFCIDIRVKSMKSKRTVFERANILEIPPFNLIGKPTKIIKLFGGPAGFEQAIKELEEQIYKVA